MDNSVLRKRLSTFKSAQGHLQTISDEVILDVLKAWEQWPGSTADLYRDLGIKKGQLSSIIRRAKQLVKNGASIESEFKEIEVERDSTPAPRAGACGIELVYKDNIIRFGSSELLLDFLNRVSTRKEAA